MTLFGYEIIKCSKRDREEEMVFKASTIGLHKTMCDFMDYLNYIHDNHDDEPSIIQHLFEFIESITSGIHVYNDNKYATPITSVSMNQRIQVILEHGARIQRLVARYNAMKLRRDMFKGSFDDEFGNEDVDEGYIEFKQEADYAEEKYHKTLQSMIRALFSDVNATCAVLQYDVYRIIYGVDFVRASKKKTKLPKGTAEFAIKIITQHKPGDANTNGGMNQ